MSSFRDHLFAVASQEPPPIERLWEISGFIPNDAQREAILHANGPLYITAFPGSGKTRVLLWRTLNLIVYHNVPLEGIFLSTFTEKAAKQLTDGLRSLLAIVTNITGRPYDLAEMYIGTVHSLCQRILTDRRRFYPHRQRPRPPRLLDDLGQYFYLHDDSVWNTITSDAGIDPEQATIVINRLFDGLDSPSRHRTIERLRSVFNRFSEELLEPTELRPRLREFNLNSFSTQPIDLLLTLYEAYRKLLQRDRRTDFSLLQQEAFRLLKDSPNSGNAFQHIIIDEYQDTNTIQERIFFHLAAGSGNLCVVGDDDQALYRFRGATVENFVQFPTRCQVYLGQLPRRITLDINYRSRPDIVAFYSRFITLTDWSSADGKTFYRVQEKNIRAYHTNSYPAVVASNPADPQEACRQIARFVRHLLNEGKVENPNQIAFLYPSLKSEQVKRMKEALEAEGLLVYAPRAGRFLDVEEAIDVFGIFLAILGRPNIQGVGHEISEFEHYLHRLETRAGKLQESDPLLKQFVQDRQAEIKRAVDDYKVLKRIIALNHWRFDQVYEPLKMKRSLVNAPGLSAIGRRLIASAYLDRLVSLRAKEGRPLSLGYIVQRATSLDWNILDLFYQLMEFEHFKAMFDRAERQGDEASVANLGLISQYLQRFVDERISIITANLLSDHKFAGLFFGSYLFALFRLSEGELEDEENPFPRGRIPFLTIHQSKGLEFPVVVLGNLDKRDRGVPMIERMIRPLLRRSNREPLERLNEFDTARMFYVALSRAKDLLVLAHFSGSGQRMNGAFRALLNNNVPRLDSFDLNNLPPIQAREDTIPKVYSFTGDYLLYQKCPRQYMIFRKFGFVPSRSQTMFFGSLVHRALEDLHHELIRRRQLHNGEQPTP